MVTPTLALMFKPAPDTTLYTSYVESLKQGASVGITYAELPRPPESAQEQAVRTGNQDPARSLECDGRLVPHRGAGPITRNSQNVLVQDGQSIYQGLELGATTRLGSQWQLGGNLMFLDTSYRRGNDFVGNRVAGAPNLVATAQLSYAVPQVPGLKLSATPSTRAQPCSTPPTS